MQLNNELEGILVISLEQAVAAPYCGLLLADAGARVIKVERPEGDFARGYDSGANGNSSIFAWLNRGKQSICLDLKNESDMVLLRKILLDADILLSNLAPGALARMGLTQSSLREQNPKLITCSISGYGESSEAAQKKAYDFLVQGEVGLSSVTGSAQAPARVGLPITDISTGLTAFSAILRGLIQRGKTGVGVDLKISMFDVMADWMNMPLLGHRYMGGAPERMGLKHSFIAPYGAFNCGDGNQILLSVQSNREFALLCEKVLGNLELASDPKFIDNTNRFANRVALDAIVSEKFAEHTIFEVTQLLDAASIANARLNSVAELSDHAFLKNATTLIEGSKVKLAALPVSTNNDTLTHVPSLNEHGQLIRKEYE